jgi:hypothetical protein
VLAVESDRVLTRRPQRRDVTPLGPRGLSRKSQRFRARSEHEHEEGTERSERAHAIGIGGSSR